MDDLSVPLAATSLASTPGRRDEEVAAASEQSTRKRRASGHSFRDVQLSGHARGHFGNSITNYYSISSCARLCVVIELLTRLHRRRVFEAPGSAQWLLVRKRPSIHPRAPNAWEWLVVPQGPEIQDLAEWRLTCIVVPGFAYALHFRHTLRLLTLIYSRCWQNLPGVRWQMYLCTTRGFEANEIPVPLS